VYLVTAASLLAFCLVYLFGFKFVAFKLVLFLAVLAALIVPLVAMLILNYRKKRRQLAFTEQMPDVLMMISRSLRAGHSMNSAIELVGSEMAHPAGELFRMAFDQQKLGLRLLDTLSNMGNRMESLDLRFFITAVTIHSEVGGNLAEILDKLAETIRERIKIRRQIRVYTAQGRLSGYVLAVMPLVAFFMMNIMLPGYEQHLFTEKIGNIMLITAFSLQLVGFLIIRKIIDIRI
jgi:tight adherence protein B